MSAAICMGVHQATGADVDTIGGSSPPTRVYGGKRGYKWSRDRDTVTDIRAEGAPPTPGTV